MDMLKRDADKTCAVRKYEERIEPSKIDAIALGVLCVSICAVAYIIFCVF